MSLFYCRYPGQCPALLWPGRSGSGSLLIMYSQAAALPRPALAHILAHPQTNTHLAQTHAAQKHTLPKVYKVYKT